MRNSRKALLRFTALGLLPFCITTAASAQTAEQIAERALAATAYLEMTDRNGKTLGFGSGFVVDQSQIATNFHVIEGAAKGTAKLVGKTTKYTIEGISAIDEKNDLAILKVKGFGGEPLPLGDSDTVKIDQTVYVAGNPKGLEGTFSDGIISDLVAPKFYMIPEQSYIITAPISPGGNGGAVLNGSGEVIGVSLRFTIYMHTYTLAIPSNYLKELLAWSGETKPLSQDEQSISTKTHFIRGCVNNELGNYNEAVAAYTQAICLGFDYDFVYTGRGKAKDKLGQYFTAITDYDTAIRLRPNFGYAYLRRGSAKAALKQYFTAITDYDTVIRLNPDSTLAVTAYIKRGQAKDSLGQYFTAITDYDTAIRLRPNSDYAYLNRGNAKAALKQHAAAIEDYDKAIQLEPDDASAYINRGRLKAILEQYLAAIADCDKAIQLEPNNARAYCIRGITKDLLGHTWEGKQDLRTALQLAKQAGDEGLKDEIEKMLKMFD